MEIVPTGAALGAEVKGVDLSKDISEADLKTIYDAYIDNQVLLFRRQELDYDDMLRIREYFGPAGKTVNQLLGLARKKHYPDEVPDGITIISTVIGKGGKERQKGLDGEAFWHTDSSFTEIPISASLLHALEVAYEGGETGFINMYQAYDDLPEELRRKIEGKYSNHCNVHTAEGIRRPEFEDVADPRTAPGVRHPLVRVHPVSGKKCLYLGRRLDSYIFDLTLDESEELLDQLWAHACQQKYVWENKWEVGDLLVWDNRCTMHHRNPFPEDARRHMQKSITAGEAVIAA